MKVRLKRSITTKITIIDRHNITKFKDAEHLRRFKSEIYQRSNDLNIDRTGSINKMWKKIQDTVK